MLRIGMIVSRQTCFVNMCTCMLKLSLLVPTICSQWPAVCSQWHFVVSVHTCIRTYSSHYNVQLYGNGVIFLKKVDILTENQQLDCLKGDIKRPTKHFMHTWVKDMNAKTFWRLRHSISFWPGTAVRRPWRKLKRHRRQWRSISTDTGYRFDISST